MKKQNRTILFGSRSLNFLIINFFPFHIEMLLVEERKNRNVEQQLVSFLKHF